MQEKLPPVESAPATLQMRDVMLANCIDYWTSSVIEPGDNLQYFIMDKLTLKDTLEVATVLSDSVVQPLFDKVIEAPVGEYSDYTISELAKFINSDGSLRLADYLINHIVETCEQELTTDHVADSLFSIIEDLDWVVEGEPMGSWDSYDLQDNLFKDWLTHFLKEQGVDEFDIGWTINVVLPRHEDRKNLSGSQIQELYNSFAQSGGEVTDFIESMLPLHLSGDDSYDDIIKDELGTSKEFQMLTPEQRLPYVKRYIRSNEEYYLLLEDNFLYYQKNIMPDDVQQVLDWLS